MDEKRKKELKALIEKRGRETTARIAKIEKSLKDQDSLIQSLNNELKVANAKAPLQKEQQARLQDNLRQAKQERDRLIDEKEDLTKKLLTYQQAQKKLQESDKRKLDQQRAAEKEAQKDEKQDNKKDAGAEKEANNANTVQEEVESNESFLHAW